VELTPEERTKRVKRGYFMTDSTWSQPAGSRTAVGVHFQISPQFGSPDDAVNKTKRYVVSPQGLTLCLEFARRVMPTPESSRPITSQ
jgi:hypothetical protein